MAKRDAITAEYVRSILHYDPETGEFRWKARADVCRWWNTRYVGSAAGAPSNRYRAIQIDKRRYYAHRLVWLYMTGEWPKEQIDHIDCNKANNCFSNLREATNSQNHANIGKCSSNTSGFKGVYWSRHTRKWHVRIKKNGKFYSLGYYNEDNIEGAAAAYAAAARDMHGEFARTE